MCSSDLPTRCERQTCALCRVAAGALCRISLLLGLIPLAFAQEAPSALEEIVVTATLISEPSAPISASVLTERSHRLRGAAHFEDLVTLVPNLTSSSGASRNRFFQIRGIGERSQFVEPVNPSVGILLDGIDLIFSLEEQFNVTVDDETARGMNTVGDIVRTIQALAAGSGQGDAADATGRD